MADKAQESNSASRASNQQDITPQDAASRQSDQQAPTQHQAQVADPLGIKMDCKLVGFDLGLNDKKKIEAQEQPPAAPQNDAASQPEQRAPAQHQGRSANPLSIELDYTAVGFDLGFNDKEGKKEQKK